MDKTDKTFLFVKLYQYQIWVEPRAKGYRRQIIFLQDTFSDVDEEFSLILGRYFFKLMEGYCSDDLMQGVTLESYSRKRGDPTLVPLAAGVAFEVYKGMLQDPRNAVKTFRPLNNHLYLATVSRVPAEKVAREMNAGEFWSP
jgi:hypothetical protein